MKDDLLDFCDHMKCDVLISIPPSRKKKIQSLT